MQYADQFTVTGNHAGIPGISMMAGLSEEKLPLSIQLLGPDFSEATLLRIGRAFEVATADQPWRDEKPKVLEGLP
jgi:aspartyl-tRNA(Asn)/glutamyl-tRNA(Gln) amidotransferase subunit A